MPSQTPSTVQHIATHILTQLDIHRSKFQSQSQSLSPPIPTTPTAHPAPLFTALQGPQGSGKSHTTSHLAQYLSSPPHNLHIATLSLDDLYLPHSALHHLTNPLLRGRGLPGTHDIGLAGEVLTQLKYINDDYDGGDGGEGGLKRINDDDDDGEGGGHVVHLPVYDKSLHNGQGDRSTHTVVVHTPPALDVVILEGWCMGFYPVSEGVLDGRWDAWTQSRAGTGSGIGNGAKKDGAGNGKAGNERNGREGICCRKEDVREINAMLEGYVGIWELFDTFVQIKPSPPPTPPPPASPPTASTTSASTSVSPSASASEYSIIYTWRLQQEHAMKAQNGGRGMSDDEVVRFVDRYIPGYFFFGDGVREGYNVGCKSGEDTDKDGETRAGKDADADGEEEGDNKAGAGADTNTKKQKQKQKQKLPPWIGKSLVVTIGPERQVLEVGHF